MYREMEIGVCCISDWYIEYKSMWYVYDASCHSPRVAVFQVRCCVYLYQFLCFSINLNYTFRSLRILCLICYVYETWDSLVVFQHQNCPSFCWMCLVLFSFWLQSCPRREGFGRVLNCEHYFLSWGKMPFTNLSMSFVPYKMGTARLRTTPKTTHTRVSPILK